MSAETRMMPKWEPLTISLEDYETIYKTDELVRLVPGTVKKETWVAVLVREDHIKDIKVKKVSLGGYF